MITYWLIGEKPTNNNVQQANPTTTIGQITTAQDQPPVATQIPTMQTTKQQEQRAPTVVQHKLPDPIDPEVCAGWPDAQSRGQKQTRPAHPGQQRPQEPQSRLFGTGSGAESPKIPCQVPQSQKPVANPACGLAVTGNGAPKSRSIVATPPIVGVGGSGGGGGSSPARNRASGAPGASNPTIHQVYPTAAESMPNHTESGPNAPLLLPAGAIPRV